MREIHLQFYYSDYLTTGEYRNSLSGLVIHEQNNVLIYFYIKLHNQYRPHMYICNKLSRYLYCEHLCHRIILLILL